MQLTEESQDKINKAAAAMATTEAKILVDNAEELIPLFISDTAQTLTEAQGKTLTAAKRKSIATKLNKKYTSDMFNKKGSTVVERVVEDLGNGKVKVYPRARFDPWLEDIPRREVAEISKKISEGSKDFVNPRIIAKDLDSHFENTKHRSVVAARTESVKLQTDVNIRTRKEAGQEFLKYHSAKLETSRPEHVARDGLVYPIDSAPILGEYQCLCSYTSGDYSVKYEGVIPEESSAIILDKSAFEGNI